MSVNNRDELLVIHSGRPDLTATPQSPDRQRRRVPQRSSLDPLPPRDPLPFSLTYFFEGTNCEEEGRKDVAGLVVLVLVGVSEGLFPSPKPFASKLFFSFCPNPHAPLVSF